MSILSSLNRLQHNLEIKKKFPEKEIREIESIYVVNNGKDKMVKISKKDGMEEFLDLYKTDDDLKEGTSLDPRQCLVIFREKLPNSKQLHYDGFDFVPKWTWIDSRVLADVFDLADVSSIRIIAKDYGQAAEISFVSGGKKVLRVHGDSAATCIGDVINPKDCCIVRMRKFHHLRFTSILIKNEQ